ncbi:Ribosomal protein [Fagus crenata]
MPMPSSSSSSSSSSKPPKSPNPNNSHCHSHSHSHSHTFLCKHSPSFCCGARSRRCTNPSCKGLKKALEFDLQLQTEDSLKSKSSKDFIDGLPWKGGNENNPDYECLRSELRKMAPPNGRAVLLFRARCGCPIAKLEGWGPKQRGRRHKKALANLAVNGGGGDHR